jgi:phosphate transport system permease protein
MNNPNLTAKRRSAERRFKYYGLAAIAVTGLFLAFLILDIVVKALPTFTVNELVLPVTIDAASMDAANPAAGDFPGLIKSALAKEFPDVQSRADRKKLNGLLSARAADGLQEQVTRDPSLIGKTVDLPVSLSSSADLYLKGLGDAQTDEKQSAWLDALAAKGLIQHGFAWTFFAQGDSREPESAGIKGALIGSILVICVTLMFALPLGVAAALYLEEFAPKNKVTDLIEVNINNLAAVPSIIFGLLGLAVFLNGFGLPRSTALVADSCSPCWCFPPSSSPLVRPSAPCRLPSRKQRWASALRTCRPCFITCCRSHSPASSPAPSLASPALLAKQRRS